MDQYIGNYSKQLKKLFNKISKKQNLDDFLEEYEVWIKQLLETRKSRIDEIDAFFEELDRIKKDNEVIEEQAKSLDSASGYSYVLNYDGWFNKYKTKFAELGGIELCEYNGLNKQDLLYENVCKLFGHDFQKMSDGNIKIVKDTTTPNIYDSHDGWYENPILVEAGEPGTKYCECNLCKRKYDITKRPLDIDDYIKKLPECLGDKPKTFKLKEKQKKLKYNPIPRNKI